MREVKWVRDPKFGCDVPACKHGNLQRDCPECKREAREWADLLWNRVRPRVNELMDRAFGGAPTGVSGAENRPLTHLSDLPKLEALPEPKKSTLPPRPKCPFCGAEPPDWGPWEECYQCGTPIKESY